MLNVMTCLKLSVFPSSEVIFTPRKRRYARELLLLDELDQMLVDGDGRRAGGETEHERPLGGRLVVVDAVR